MTALLAHAPLLQCDDDLLEVVERQVDELGLAERLAVHIRLADALRAGKVH